MRRSFSGIFHFNPVGAGNPELVRARHRVLTGQMPVIYFIILSSTWVNATTYMAVTPFWLATGIPALLTVICTLHLHHWLKSRHVDPALEKALAALEKVNYLAFGISAVLIVWSFLLFPYGDAYARSYLAFYIAIIGICCFFGLMRLRLAALILALIVNGALIFLLATADQPAFVAMKINTICVSIGMLMILNSNYRTVVRVVKTQASARRKSEHQGRLLRMIDNMPVAVMTIDPDTLKITYANETSKNLVRNVEHLLPIKADDLVGSSMDVFHKHPEHQRRILSDPANLPFNGRMNLGSEVLDVKVAAIMADDGTYLGPMLTWALVTQEVAAERRIQQLAHYDTLTGLANRLTFKGQMDAHFAAPGEGPNVLYIDLDGFKLVNDTSGHGAGDDLLKQVANRLRTICNDPAMTIGRLGGDEFAVLVPHGVEPELEQLAQRIIAALSAPYILNPSKKVQISASIGIAIAPAHGETGDALLGRADIALYAAKAAGKGTYRRFSADMESRIQDRARLQVALRHSLETKEGIFVFYQPIIDARTKKITTREALIRWHHPQWGWVPPAEFVPIAEQSGLIDQLGEFVLNRACRDATGWNDNARVAVNISAAQLGKGSIVPCVLEALARSGLSPDRLEVEVTETAMLDDEYESLGDLRRLRDIGVRLALDDFGTGYSSLTHLRAFPFDKIKIDGSFVKAAVERPESAAVVRAIVDLGKRLGVTTVAEGVETEAQLNRVLEEGCDEIQGYFYGQPQPVQTDIAIIDELKPNNSAKEFS